MLLSNLRRLPSKLIEDLQLRSTHSRRTLIFIYFVGSLATVIAISLLLYWATHIALLRIRYTTAARELAYLTERTELLKSQYEAEKAFGSIALRAAEEQAKSALLPGNPDSSRLIRSFDILAESLRKQGKNIIVQRVLFDRKTISFGSGTALQGTAVIVTDTSTLAAFLAPFDLAAHPSVGSIVTSDTKERFLRAVSSYDTASLLKTYELLTTDLLTFSMDPTPIFDRGLVGVPPDAAIDLQTLLLSQGLKDAVDILQPFARDLRAGRVWPLPLMTITKVQGDGHRFEMTFQIYGRFGK